MISTILTSVLLASSVLAAPFQKVQKRAMKGADTYTPDITIHESCDATQTGALQQALSEMKEITNVAKNYVLANGANDTLIQRYFGKEPDYVAIVGALNSLQQSNKQGVMLRCDDPDDNCRLDGWAGHWRGDNATLETVICPLSYEIRKPLSDMCNNYTVVDGSPSFYFATDLVHRMYHVPTVANEQVTHHADTYAECLELALTDPTKAAYNTHTLQYFASDVWAMEVARPGEGCTGDIPAPALAPAASATSTASYSVHSNIGSTATASAAQSCHTHEGGELHCV